MKKTTYIAVCVATMLCSVSMAWSAHIPNRAEKTHLPTIGWRETAYSTDKSGHKRIGRYAPDGSSEFVKTLSPGQGIAKRAMDCGASIYGYKSYPTGYGFYELNGHSAEFVANDPLFYEYWWYASNGWFDNGKICGYSLEFEGPQNVFYKYFEIDFASNSILKFEQLPTDGPVMVTSTLNADDNYIYGVGGVPAECYGFYRAPKENPGNMEFICPYSSLPPYEIDGAQPDLCSLCFNPVDGCLYGININSEFVKIGTDGKQTFISTMPDAERFTNELYFGMTYSPVDKKFYCTPVTLDYTSQLFSITPQGVFRKESDDEIDAIFPYLFTTDSKPDATTPEVPEFVSIQFDGGHTSGEATFRMPTCFGNGTPLPETINYVAVVDGETYAQATATPGSKVTVKYSELSNGSHRFGLYAEVDGKKSATAAISKWIGTDTPESPQNVKITPDRITWNPVTEGQHGGYINLQSLTYEVFLNNKKIGETNEPYISSGLSPDTPFSAYTASVTAVSENMRSEPAESATLLFGRALSLPVTLLPQSDEYELFTKIKNEEAFWDWRYRQNEAEPSPVFIENTYNYGNNDVWLFLPPVRLDYADRYYTFELECSLFDASDSRAVHNFEVALCSKADPESKIDNIIARFKPSVKAISEKKDFEKVAGLIKIEHPGDYYIGLHAIPDHSNVSGGNCGFRNFSVTDNNITPDSPAIPSDLSITEAENGELAAIVSFTFPSVDLSGQPLPAGTKLKATIRGDETVTCTGLAGEKKQTKVRTLQGDNIIYFSIESEQLNGETVHKMIYTGAHIPAMIESLNAEVADDLTSVSMRWNPVTESIDGGYLNPANVRYRIEAIGFRDEEGEATCKTIAENLTATEYHFELPADAPQCFYDIYIVASNEAGDCGTGLGRTFYLGTPYRLPFHEGFENGPYCCTTMPWIMYDTDNYYSYVEYRVFNLEKVDPDLFKDSDKCAFALHSSFAEDLGTRLGLPRFSTTGCNEVKLSLNTLIGERTAGVSVKGATDNSGTLTAIGDIPVTSEARHFKESTFILPEKLLNRPWVQLYLDFDFNGDDDAAVIQEVSITGNTGAINTAVATCGEIKTLQEAVLIKNLKGKVATIIRPDGVTMINTPITSDTFRCPLPPGIYMVKAGDIRTKVMIR